MRAIGITGLVFVAGIAAFTQAPDACGCALVPRAGDSVHVAEESAVIIWDAATRTQHFIRRAQFDTKAQDFGFLVPTPARPALAEVEDRVFDDLVNVTRPPVREAPRAVRKRSEKQVALTAAAPPRVTVLETATVAGLDAAVLAANDAQALNRWLRDHGYASSPELAEWFKPYIAAKWIVTAFKISKGASRAERAVTSAVRMSFKTERPFFPYREPATKGSAPRALEVYFLSGERVEGQIGTVARSWPGLTLWAKPLSESDRKELLERVKLPANALPATAWLTRFLDSSSPRPGTDDLYFSRTKDQLEYLDAYRLESELSRKESARYAAVPAVAPSPAERAAESAVLYRQAMEMEKSGNTNQAIRIYRRAARGGSGEAAKRLGDIYDKGAPGVSRDHAESLQWYETARERGVAVEAAGKR